MMQSVHTWPPFLVSPLAHAEALDVWSSLFRAFIEPPIPFTPPDDRDYPGGLSIHMAHRQGRGPRCGGSNGAACGALVSEGPYRLRISVFGRPADFGKDSASGPDSSKGGSPHSWPRRVQAKMPTPLLQSGLCSILIEPTRSWLSPPSRAPDCPRPSWLWTKRPIGIGAAPAPSAEAL